jgi:DNA/RNA endonuclease G (NUC1)
MNDLTGFFLNPFNQNGDPHGKVVSWYAKTVDINLDQIDVDGRFSNQSGTYTPNTAIYDRLGESDIASLLGSATAAFPWFNREGSGQGWGYSVLGGGKANRPNMNVNNVPKVPVSWDNTLQVRSRGDFAIPTLFNGNFDAEFEQPIGLSNVTDSSIQRNTISNAIAGWSFRNNATGATWESNVVKNGDLKDWKDIPTFADSNGYLSKLGIDPTAANYQPNYAIELNSSRNTITHNRFLVPDWGALRFDLFTGAIASSTTGTLKVFLDALDGSSATEIDYVDLQQANGNPSQYLTDTHKIGYGETGFETFVVDIPDAWRGKNATLRFELVGNSQPVYLDNVFFKNQNLLLGNPTEARTTGSPVTNAYYNNYLLDRAQYATSFSGDSHIPNWSAWQVNNSWLGSGNRTTYFRDPDLSNIGLISAKNEDYTRPTTEIPGPLNSNNQLYIYSPGHLATNADRNRTKKDANATFSTANLLPQRQEHNEKVWLGLENFTRALVEKQGREVYVYAGGVGENTVKSSMTVTDDSLYGSYAIQAPENLWKVLIVLDHPGLGISDITTTNSKAFAVLTRNAIPNPLDIKWNEGGMSIITVEQLEEELNSDPNNIARGIHYNFFSNLSNDLQHHLKTTPVSVPLGNTPYQAFLLAETDNSSNNYSQLGTSSNTAIGHDSFIENSTHQIWATFDSKDISINNNIFTGVTIDYNNFSQIGFGEISSFHAGTREISPTKNSLSEVAIIGNTKIETGISQVTPLEVSTSNAGNLEANILQIGSAEINAAQGTPSQIRPSQVDTSQVGSFERNISLNTTFQIDPWKVSLSSSITSQQFTSSLNLFDSHNSNLQNTTVPTWTEFLQSPTPFNLKIEIQDLPTGQLAEASRVGNAHRPFSI